MSGADRSVEEVQLEGYFVAALAFIDPQLTSESPLPPVLSVA